MAAFLALAGLLARPVLAEEPAPEPGPVVGYHAPGPVPPVYAPLLWVAPDGSSTGGYWFSADQVRRINAQMTYLEERAAQECWTKTVAEEKAFFASKPVLVVGLVLAVLAGGAAGFYIAKKL